MKPFPRTFVKIARSLVPADARVAGRRWLAERARHARQAAARRQLAQAARAVSAECLADVRTAEDWHRRRSEIRRQLRTMLGLEPLPDRTPLAPEARGALDRPGYRIEKWVFQPMPGMHATANFYLPAAARGPVPCILYLCGHRAHPCGAKTQYQDRFLWYPAHGFACLVLDSLNCGEVPGLHHGTQNLNRPDWLSRGYTPAGVEVWSAMRALDYLETRPEVDGRRIGATGISGGGVMTTFLAALDERIQAAAPSCSAYTVGDQATHARFAWQCDCTFYPNWHRVDYPAVAALVAPRPLLLTNGRKDRIFPPAGAREVGRRARWIYELLGAGDRIRSVESNAGHDDPPLFLRESRRWMCRWLHPEPATVLSAVADAVPASAPADTLACFSSPPRTSANYDVHERFIPAAKPAAPASGGDVERLADELRRRLRDTVFSWFPPRPAAVPARRVGGSSGRAGHFASAGEWLLETEPGILVRAFRYDPTGPASAPPLVVVRRLGDRPGVLDDEWLPLLGTRTVVAVHPRFSEGLPSAAAAMELERLAALSGRTLAALQIWDVLRTVEWLGTGAAAPVSIVLHGGGAASIVALYAALFSPAVGELVLRDPPASHRSGPALLGVLRTADVADVAAALAPRTLTWLSDPPPAFDGTRQAYRRCGAEDRFRRASSLAGALLDPAPVVSGDRR